MGGRIDYARTSTPLARSKAVAAVFRNLGPGNQVYLPNIIAETVQERFGASPAVCQMRYTASDAPDNEYPARIDDTMPLDAVGPYVVRPDDRLAVAVFDSFGTPRWLFDGFAKVPECAMTSNTERSSFQAISVAEREWDTPLTGSLWRDGDVPNDGSNAFAVGIASRFNPDGKANATPDGADYTFDDNGYKTPLFLDPLLCKSAKIGRKWSLAMAARYVLAVGNGTQQYVKLPDWSVVDQLLDAWTPKNGNTLDPTDPSTFTRNPIILRDITVSGKAWPMALDELIRPHGFAMRFEVSNDGSGDPVTRLILWKRDSGDGKRYKDVLLPIPGTDLDPAAANLGACHFARDTAQVANQVLVETDLLEHEASFVLAPGFQIAVADAAAKANFKKAGNAAFDAHKHQYRRFVFDETGEGHWDWASGTWVTGTGTDLTPVLGLGNQDPSLWVARRRPGKSSLISKDFEGVALKFAVAVCCDYAGPCPGVWDGTGAHWRACKGDFGLLEDRLGIEIGSNDPNDLDVGAVGTGPDAQFNSRKLRLVEWMSPAPPTFKVFWLLTCKIEGDQRANVFLPRRSGSLTRFTITEHIDAKDRYKTELVSKWSAHAQNFGQAPDAFGRDDSGAAIDEAQSRLSAVDVAHLAGTMTVPRVTLAYSIGDRAANVRGRGVSLQTNAGGAGQDPPTYPEIVGRTFSLTNNSTALSLSDARADHQNAI